jgi:hypothetical protein
MIFFGEKRVGKSTIANIFIPALVGEPMSGTITDTALDKPFYFDSYKGKLHVSVNDVVSLTSVAKGHLGNTTKDAKIYGEGKYDKGATFHNVCRNTVTTNVERINISLDGAFDPATFHVRTHTNMSLGMTPEEFEVWRSGLRKLYFDDFYAAMDDEDDMNHYMWFFKNFEYTREELLDTSYSAYNDPEMARHNAPYPVLALAELIKNGTFGNGSITNPFTSRCMKDELDSINRIVSKFPVTADDVIRAIEHIQITVSRGEHYIPTVYFGTMLERFESYYKFNPSPNHKNAVEIAEERALGKDSTYFGCIDPATVILPAPKKHKF